MTDTQLAQFREATKAWLADNFPAALANKMLGYERISDPELAQQLEVWRQKLAEQG